MYYHGSPVPNIEVLTPHISNHGVPLLYFSTKRENTIVYLSNAIEKYHRENHIPHSGRFHKWGSYGFTKDGILELGEYYPDAVRETYQGAAGYVYSAEHLGDPAELRDIPFAVTSSAPAAVSQVEYIPDAYGELLRLEAEGLIIIRRYEQNSEVRLSWIRNTVQEEYATAQEPDYRRFLKAKFPFIMD